VERGGGHQLVAANSELQHSPILADHSRRFEGKKASGIRHGLHLGGFHMICIILTSPKAGSHTLAREGVSGQEE
jgi:hypothetical protein